MKNFILLMLSTMWAASQIFAQNPYWAFSPKYVDFKTGLVNTLGAGSATKYKTGNAIFSPTGNLLLNVLGNSSNSRIIYKNSLDVNSPSLPQSELMGDFAIVPFPGQCQTYLVPYFGSCNCNTCGGSYPNIYYSSLVKTNFIDNVGHLCVNSTGSTYTRSFGHSLGMAAAPTPDISGASAKPYLYVARVAPVTNPFPVCSYSSNNILLDIYYGMSGNAAHFTSFPIGSTSAGAVYIGEVDLSFDGTKIAISLIGSNVIYLINNVNACVSGTCSSSNVSLITVSATAVNGIEFSPDGSKLFYTKSTSSPSANQIGYVDLNTLAQSDVNNSVGLGSSFLEYATDGYMYVSDGSNLKGFNLSTYTVSKIISGVPNSSQYNGVYTLPDQIDGFNYDNFGGGCQTGSVSYTSNPFKELTQVNGTITAGGTASVSSGANVLFASNSSVLLQPNFTVLSGSNFTAKIAPCNLTCSAQPTCSTSYRLEEEESFDNEATSVIGEVHIHPNPINAGYLQFGKTVSSYSMTNSSGQLVQQGKNADKLDVTGLPKGLYLLKLDDKVEKVIVE